MSSDPRSILVIDASGFARSLALLPALRALRWAYPKTFITAAVGRGLSEMLATASLVDQVIDLGVISASSDGLGGAVKRFARLLSRTRKGEYDLVLDFSPGPETQAISRLVLRARTFAPSRLAHMFDTLLGRGPKGEASKAVASGDHVAECAGVLAQLGIRMDETRLDIDISAQEHTGFEELLRRSGSRGGEPVVVMHSVQSGGLRVWPAERFGELAFRLANNFGARIVAADEPGRSAFTDAVGSLLPRGAIKLQSPRAPQMLAAIARASILVTDEREMATAALDFGTPVLEIAEKAAPVTRKNHRVVAAAAAARASSDEVYEVACEMLQESRSSILFER
jgi:lipopolysaccharide heptosyltransferase II